LRLRSLKIKETKKKRATDFVSKAPFHKFKERIWDFIYFLLQASSISSTYRKTCSVFLFSSVCVPSPHFLLFHSHPNIRFTRSQLLVSSLFRHIVLKQGWPIRACKSRSYPLSGLVYATGRKSTYTAVFPPLLNVHTAHTVRTTEKCLNSRTEHAQSVFPHLPPSPTLSVTNKIN
jgi:hypothetical protein